MEFDNFGVKALVELSYASISQRYRNLMTTYNFNLIKCNPKSNRYQNSFYLSYKILKTFFRFLEIF
jgi:hypothetical protein